VYIAAAMALMTPSNFCKFSMFFFHQNNVSLTITLLWYQAISYWPSVSDRQWELSDHTPVRFFDDNWFEFDAGEISVSDEEKLTSLEFSMVVPTKGVLLWKSGICLEGVVLRPSLITKSTGQYFRMEAHSSLPTLTNEQDVAPVLGYPSDWKPLIGEQGVAPVLGYFAEWATSIDEQGVAPVLGYSAKWATSIDEQGVAPLMGYSAEWATSIDEQDILQNTSSIDSTPEAQVLGYSTEWSTSIDEQGIVRITNPIASTPEAPMLMHMYPGLSPILSNIQNGQNEVGTVPIYSSDDPSAAFDSMSLVDEDAADPSSAATDHKKSSYNSSLSDSAGVENMEAPLHTSGARSKGLTVILGIPRLYTDDDADVKVPFYTATGARF
jgi:hypothetical protein